ncbi:MAG: hypothetical protein ACYDDF_10560 [Thermoplasmatota archaeon]
MANGPEDASSRVRTITAAVLVVAAIFAAAWDVWQEPGQYARCTACAPTLAQAGLVDLAAVLVASGLAITAPRFRFRFAWFALPLATLAAQAAFYGPPGLAAAAGAFAAFPVILVIRATNLDTLFFALPGTPGVLVTSLAYWGALVALAAHRSSQGRGAILLCLSAMAAFSMAFQLAIPTYSFPPVAL